MTPSEAQSILRELAGIDPGPSLGVQFATAYELDPQYLFEAATVGISRSRLAAWRRKVLERDQHQCRMCDDARNLEAHHCRPKSMFPELAYDTSNGVMLCYRCHRVIVHGSNTWDLTSWQRFIPLWDSMLL